MQLRVNSLIHQFYANPDTPLLWGIRDELGMTGTTYGCGLSSYRSDAEG